MINETELTPREIADMRRHFEESHGASPEAWLDNWRSGKYRDNEANNLTAIVAEFLVGG